jgi:hypothetical protein
MQCPQAARMRAGMRREIARLFYKKASGRFFEKSSAKNF